MCFICEDTGGNAFSLSINTIYSSRKALIEFAFAQHIAYILYDLYRYCWQYREILLEGQNGEVIREVISG